MPKGVFLNNIRFFSSKEAGEISGYTHDYISRLCRQGKLSGKKIGKVWFVEEHSFLDFLVKNGSEKAEQYKSLSEERKQEYVFHEVVDTTAIELETTSSPTRTRFLHPLVALSLSVAIVFGGYFVKDTPRAHAFLDALQRQAVDTVMRVAKLPTSLPVFFEDLSGGVYDAQIVSFFSADNLARPGERFLAAINATLTTYSSVIHTSGRVMVALPSATIVVGDTLRTTNLSDIPNYTRTAAISLSGFIQDVSNTVRGVVANWFNLIPREDQIQFTITQPQQPTQQQPQQPTTIVQQPVIERVVEHTQTIVQSGVTEEYVRSRLEGLNNKLSSEIYRLAGAQGNITQTIVSNYNTISQTNKIDDLANVTLRNSTITNSPISGASGSFTGLTTETAGVSGNFTVGGNGLVYDASSGNVGVGTSSPFTKFSVVGDGYFSGTLTAASFSATGTSAFSGLTTFENGFISQASSTISSGGLTTVGYSTTTQALIVQGASATSTFAGGLIIDTNGFVYDYSTNRIGVGTTTPASILDIYGTDALRIPVGTTAQRPALNLQGQIRYSISNSQFEGYDGTNWQGLGGVVDVDLDTYIDPEETTDDDFLRFYTAGTQRAVITNTGNVGVGTSSPYAKLSVHALSNDADTGQLVFAIASSTASATSTLFSVNNAGDVGIGTAAPTTQLEIRDTTDVLARLVRTGNGATFIRRSGSSADFVSESTSSTVRDIRLISANAVDDSEVTHFFIDGDTGRTGVSSTTPWARFSIAGASAGAYPLFAVSTSTASATSTAFIIDANGRVGIGTTSPARTFSVVGNGYITGGFGIGIATTSAGVLQTSSNAYIGGDLLVVGNSTVLGNSTTIGASTANTLTINSTINSDLIPDVNAVHDIGSPSFFWDDGFFDTITANNISAASSTISGTQAATFTINSDNATADTESSDLLFFRGTVVPNALISWNSTLDKFDFNQPIFFQSDSSTTTIISLDVWGKSGQTADLFRVASSSGTSVFSITSDGNVGIGTTTPYALFSVAGSAVFDGTVTATNLVATGTTQFTGLSTFANGFISQASSTISAGGLTTVGYSTTTQALIVQGASATSTFAGGLAVETSGLVYDYQTNRVGIGTASPSYKLEVAGDINLTSGGSYLLGTNAIVGKSSTFAIQFGGADIVFKGTSGDIALFSASAPASSLILNSSGNLGIGTTSPYAKLSVVGEAVASHFTATTTTTNTFPNLLSTNATTTSLYIGSLTGVLQSISGRVSATSSISSAFIEDVYLKNNADDTTTGQLTAPNFVANSASATSTFAGGLAVETSGLVYDYQTNRVGIGTASPTVALDVVGQGLFSATTTASYLAASTLGFAGAPALTFASDLNTGVWSSGADTLNFSTGGSERFRINSSGNVGIGTTSPFATLSVAGSGFFNGGLTASTITATSTITASDTVTAPNFVANSASATSTFAGGLAIETSGLVYDYQTNRVGIGTASPKGSLEVNGQIFIADGTSAAPSIEASNFTDTGIWFRDLGSGLGAIQFESESLGGNSITEWNTGGTRVAYLTGGGSFITTNLFQADNFPSINRVSFGFGSDTDTGIGGDGSNLISLITGGTAKLVVDANGNVGIGTTSPFAKLSVVGEVVAANFTGTTTAASSVGGQFTAPNFVANSASATSTFAGGLAVETSGLVYDYQTNRVGIGTAAPNASLDVYSSARLGRLDGNGDGFLFDENAIIHTFNGEANPRFQYDRNVNPSGGTSGTIAFGQGGASTIAATGGAVGQPAARTLAFSTSDGSALTERLRIDSSGNVGIGTTSPYAKLSVVGEAVASHFTATTTTTNTFPNLLSTNATTTSLYIGSLTGVLQSISGQVSATSSISSAFIEDVYLKNNADDTTTGQLTAPNFVANSASATSTFAGGLAIETSGLVYDYQTNRVGIGTSSPDSLLTLEQRGAGTAFPIFASSDNNSGFKFCRGLGAAAPGCANFSVTSYGAATINSDNAIYINPANTQALAAHTNGYVGIGTMLPNTLVNKFTVDGNIAIGTSYITTAAPANGMIVEGSVGIGTTSPYAKLSVTNTGTGPSFIVEDSASPDSTPFIIDASGNAGVKTSIAVGASGESLLVGGNIGLQGENFDSASGVAKLIYVGGSSGNVSLIEGEITNYINGANWNTDTIFYTRETTTNSEVLRLTSAGNVGIGNTSPGNKLTVNGTASALNLVATSTTATSTFAGGLAIETSGLVYDYQTNRVGIGTASPTGAILHVSGDTNQTLRLENSANNSRISFVDSGTTADTMFIGSNSGDFNIFTAGAERLRIDSSGNVGIGTTTPKSPLAVTGASSAAGVASIWASSGATTDAAFQVYGDTNPELSRFVVQRGGNVGIGTTTPGSNLHIQKASAAGDHTALRVENTTTSGYSTVWISDNNDGLFRGGSATGDTFQNKFAMLTSGATPIGIFTNNLERLSVTSGGNVGIGQVAPTSYGANTKNLHIGNGDASTVNEDAYITMQSGNGAGGARTWDMHVSGAGAYWELADSNGTGAGIKVGYASAVGVQFYGYGAGTLVTDASGNITASSDTRLKNIEGNFSRGLADLKGIQPISYKWNATSTFDTLNTYSGFSAQNIQENIPEAVATGTNGYLGLQDRPILATVVNAINTIGSAIDVSSAPTTTPSLYIDSNGNVGVGTTTPAYKLHVIGDVAAQSFVNISTRDAKTNITYLNQSDETDILTAFKNIKVAKYRYTTEDPLNPLRLGLIAEEAPLEVLSVSGKGVDIYKLATFNIAATHALSGKLDALENRVAALEAGAGSGSGGASLQAVIDYLATLGTTIADGVARFVHIVTENLTIGTATQPAGITLYDEQTSEPYCVKVSGGQLVSTAGVCADIPVASATTTPTTTDTTPPVITISGNNPAEIALGASYVDLGATVSDNVSDNIGMYYALDGVSVTTVSIDTSTDRTYTVTYSATDQAGNSATADRTVIVGAGTATSTPPVADTTAPVITLLGNATESVVEGGVYTDAGATATDDTDGDSTANIVTVNPVDTAVVGEYAVTYNVTDLAGNSAIEVTRTVSVTASSTPSTP